MFRHYKVAILSKCLSLKGSPICAVTRSKFSVSSPLHYPRGGSREPSEHEQKWQEYLHKPKPSAGDELIRQTRFGAIRLDDDNKEISLGDSLLIGRPDQDDPSDDQDSFNNLLFEDEVRDPVKSFVKSNSSAQEYQPEPEPAPLILKPKSKGEKVLPPTTTRALSYVRKARADEILKANAKVEAASRHHKEAEVADIDKGLQQRVNRALNVTTTSLRQSTIEDHENHSTSFISQQNIGGPVNPKYMPTDLSKLTSAEVINELKSSIIYDTSEYIVVHMPLLKEAYSFSSTS